MGFTITPKAPQGGEAASAATSQHFGQSKSQAASRERALKIMLGESLNPPPHEAMPPSSEPAQTPAATQETKASPASTATNPHATDSTDAPAATPVSETAKPTEEPLSSQYAQLARKEKALRAEAMKLKAEREAWKREQESSKPASQLSQQQAFDRTQYIDKQLFAADPQRALLEAGLTYDQFTQAVLASPSSPSEVALQHTVSQLQAELKAVKEATEKTQSSLQERETNSYNQALNQIEMEAKALAASDPEFEMIKATNSAKDVRDLIERTYKEDGRLMSVEEAARMVEDYLTEEYLKLSTVGKIQKRLQPAPKQTEAATQAPATQSQPKTLTNAVTSTPKMSRTERAMAVFRGEKI